MLAHARKSFLPRLLKIAFIASVQRRSLPTWLKLSSEDVKDQIYKLAKKGLTPSQIGVILRDSHGVAQVSILVDKRYS